MRTAAAYRIADGNEATPRSGADIPSGASSNGGA
jgi:hypothetical protein